MLQNEMSQAECEEQNIGDVYDSEMKLLLQKEMMTKENDKRVLEDLREQSKSVEAQITDVDNAQTKQNFIFEQLGAKQ